MDTRAQIRARDDAAWALRHLGDVSVVPTTPPKVLVRAESAADAALDALTAVRQANAASGEGRILAWRTADWWLRRASAALTAAREDAQGFASVDADMGAFK